MLFVLRTISLFSLACALTGCVPIIVGGMATTGGYLAVRDKSIGTSFTDTKMDAAIKSRIYKIDKQLYSDVSVSVDRGCVLLTGVVNNPEFIGRVEKEAWSVDGVKIVDNNLTAGEQIPMSQILKDGAITSACRTSLMCSSGIKSVNYKLKTTNGVVYVTGLAKSEEELNLVLSKIQKIKGVKKVVSYVNAKPIV